MPDDRKTNEAEPEQNQKQEKITTKIWFEEAEPDNPFAARACYCSGYDVYGELLGKAGYIEYLFLLFKLEKPNPNQKNLLETLSVALANPGPRDHSVRAAMNAGVGGSTHASALIAALGVGAGNLGGSREVYHACQYWQSCGMNLPAWREILSNPPRGEKADVWLEMEHPPGFDPQSVSCRTPVLQTLNTLSQWSEQGQLRWLEDNRVDLETCAGMPLTMSGVAAAAFTELDLNPDQSEMLYLLMRLPGAAVHALEQEKMGVSRYPFFGDGVRLTNDPGPVTNKKGWERWKIWLKSCGRVKKPG